MRDEAPGRSRQGTVTVLALLLSLLLGYAPAAASTVETDRAALRLGKPDALKSGAVLRTGGRLQSDDSDRDHLLAGSSAGIVTNLLWQRPAHVAAATPFTGVAAPAPHAYRARAPPAA